MQQQTQNKKKKKRRMNECSTGAENGLSFFITLVYDSKSNSLFSVIPHITLYLHNLHYACA